MTRGDIDPDRVPSVLKGAGWLMWGGTVEKQPHWKGDTTISWSDPGDWHHFEEAYEAAQENPEWGIGFVVAPDTPFHVLDVDGGVNDRGGPKDWVPSFDVFNGETYMEYSPSGTGIHVPILGHPPGWWRDKEHEDPDIHEGVDVLTNKFCTYTGDRVDTSADEVGSVDEDAYEVWLCDAWDYWDDTIAPPRRPDDEDPAVTNAYDGGEWLDEDTVSEALSHLDPDMGYSEWRDVAFAVHDWDHTATGQRVFEDWSSAGSKWDADAERSVDWIWKNADQGSGITAATAVHKAKQRGWQPPKGTSIQDPDEALDDLRATLMHCEDKEDGPDEDERKKIGRLLGGITDDAFEDLRGLATEVLDCEDYELDRHRDREQHRAATGTDIVVEGGKTFHITESVPAKRVPVLNFELRPKALLDIPGEVEQAELELVSERKILTKTVPTKAFHEKREFNSEILTAFGMDMEGGNDRENMSRLNKFIAACDIPELKGTRLMGLHGDEWIIPGASLTPDGWDSEPKTRYVERNIAAEKCVKLDTEKDDYDRVDVATILRELPRIRPEDRIIPVIAWFYSAPFRPHIMKLSNQFNFLNVTGETRSGKSTTLGYIWQCLGMKGEPLSVTDTKFTKMVTMASTHSIPMWYDEYKPSEQPDYLIKDLHEKLRTATIGGLAQRGKQDQSTEDYELKAPVAVSGEQEIKGPAEERRGISVKLVKKTTYDGTPYRAAYKSLAGEATIDEETKELNIPEDYPDPAEHAQAYLRYVTAQDHDTNKARWHDALERAHAARESWDTELDLGDLEMQGLQTIIFGWTTYVDFAETMGVDASELPGEDALDAALRHVAGNVGTQGRRKTDLDIYLELIAEVARNGNYLQEGKHYVVVNAGKSNEELRFHHRDTYAEVKRYWNEYDKDDRILGDTDYWGLIKGRAIDEENLLWTHYSQPTSTFDGNGRRAVGVHMQEAEDRLDDFSASDFGGTPSSDDVDGEQAADPGVPINRLEDKNGYQTPTAKVLTVDTDGPSNGPAITGVLEDDTGVVDYVCWEDPGDLKGAAIEEDATYRIEKARIGVRRDDGATQVELTPHVTTLSPVQAGVGNAPVEDAGGNETLPAADGGELEGAKAIVHDHLSTRHESGETVRRGGIAAAAEVPPEDAKHALEALADQGVVTEQSDGSYVVL